ncbi:hypothetical protein VCRA2134O163_10261 [Vibrio crassostreae]|nr:hypothetical protein VCRA2134O163_10261 [Vibrio crassostreae]
MTTSYDGKKVYKYMSASQASYEIKGDKLHKYMSVNLHLNLIHHLHPKVIHLSRSI